MGTDEPPPMGGLFHLFGGWEGEQVGRDYISLQA